MQRASFNKSTSLLFATMLAATLSFGAPAQFVSADSSTIDFEGYALGTPNNQNGWVFTGPYDVAIANNTSGSATFGAKSLRISNAVTSGSFGDWVFSRPLADEAGETSAANDGLSGGTRQPYFEVQFDIASAVPAAEQPGLQFSTAADRGDGARMTFLRFNDTPGGIDITFSDYQSATDTFPTTVVSTGLTRTVPHRIRMTVQFVDGVSNDVVKVYVDGNLVHTGTTWEDYYRVAEVNPTRTVDSMLFQARSGAGTAPATLGNGFLIDNMTLFSGPVPAPPCTTLCYVDAASGSDSNSGVSTATAFKTIQKGLTTVQASGTVMVAAGTYTETLVINKSLLLKGAGAATTFIKAPATLPVASNPDSTIVKIAGAGVNAELTGFTVAGPGPSSCGSILAGIFVRDGANANIHDNSVLDIRDDEPSGDTPFSGCQNGIGIIVGRQQIPTSATATIKNNLISGYQKNGIVVSNAGSNALIDGNTVAGFGPQTTIAQNGVQVSAGAVATLQNNTIKDHQCNNASCGPDVISQVQSGGVLLMSAGTGTVVRNNLIQANDMGVYAASGDVEVRENNLTANRYAGIFADQGKVTLNANEITGASNFGVVVVSYNGNTANSEAVLANNVIKDATEGVKLVDETTSDSFIPTLSGSLNSIADGTNGLNNTTTGAITVEKNWWGNATGPTNAGNPSGTGAVVAGNADFDPWLCDGTDTSPSTGFQPNAAIVCGGNPPDTLITGTPLTLTNALTASFTFTGSDDVTPAGNLSFECKLDAGSFAACAPPKLYTSLSDGSHVFSVRAKDPAGSVDASPAAFTWTVDATPPTTTILSGPLTTTTALTATFTFTGSDNLTLPQALKFECSLDGGAWTACTSPYTVSGLSAQTHQLQVRAQDAAGNVEVTPAAFSWKVILPEGAKRYLYLPLIFKSK